MSDGERMTAPLYDAWVPVVRQMLGVLPELLRKGEAHAREQGSDPETILEARLAPDMLTLMGQVQRASDHAKGAAARLAGVDPPSYADDERGLAEAHARITKTLNYIDSLPRAAFDGAAGRVVTLPGDGRQMPAAGYLYRFALPSLVFHVSIAYAILRSRGVPLKKSDFLGRFIEP
jgi:uncharacterized protein